MAQSEVLKDNTYAGAFGDAGWGAKASEVISFHEMPGSLSTVSALPSECPELHQHTLSSPSSISALAPPPSIQVASSSNPDLIPLN